MGARAIGQIAYLAAMAPPRIAVVLNVGSAHLGEFGTREAIGRTKAELVQALPATGFAVLNADDPIVSGMAGQTLAHVIPVGESAAAAVRAVDITLDPQGRAAFTLVTDQGSAPVALGLHGAHHVGNALAVAAVALAVGMPLADLARALGDARPLSRWRMEVHERADGVTIVNDAYNANPDSMRAALNALAAMGQGRRTWAVLGVMLELGPESITAHDALGRLAVRLNVSRLVAVGQGTQRIDSGARDGGSSGEESTWVPDIDAAYELLRRELAPGDVVLLKSSHDAGLWRLGDRLLEDAGSEALS
jgi:UDP-N-acetylmuramoyl-tripeptide--D-alanyl-D-alanine ligase